MALAMVLDQPLWCGRLTDWLGADVFKLLLQFLLITLLGGGVFAYFAARREEQARAEVRIGDLQTLDRELGDAYRAVKRIKRRMRARLKRGRDASAAKIDEGAFGSTMDEILDAQIATEEVREHVAVRADLMDDPAARHLAFTLRYATRYLHDVYEDFERGRVRRAGSMFVIGGASPNLVDFLLEDALPDDLRSRLATVRDDQRPLKLRFADLEGVERDYAARGTDGRRHGSIAMECFRLASAQIRAALAEALLNKPYQA